MKTTGVMYNMYQCYEKTSDTLIAKYLQYKVCEIPTGFFV